MFPFTVAEATRTRGVRIKQIIIAEARERSSERPGAGAPHRPMPTCTCARPEPTARARTWNSRQRRAQFATRSGGSSFTVGTHAKRWTRQSASSRSRSASVKLG
jgi:hypothetical protein